MVSNERLRAPRGDRGRLFRSLYGKAAQLATGTAVAQLGALAAIPVLARVFSPEEFGAFSIFFFSSQLMGVLLGARYEQAVMIAGRKREVQALLIVTTVIAAIGTVAAITVLAVVHPFLDAATGVSLGLWWPVAALCGLFVSASTTLTVLAIRHERYMAVSASRLTKLLVALGLQVALALTVLPGLAGLATGEIIGTICSTALLYLYLRRDGAFSKFPRIDRALHRRYIFGIAGRHSIFPRASLPQSLNGSLTALATMILVASFFSAREAGQWFMMQRVVMMPTAVIGTSMAQIYFAEAASSIRRGDGFSRVFGRVAIGQALIGLMVAATLILWGGQLFPMILGHRWEQAGVLSTIYAPYTAVHLVLSTLAATIILAKRQSQAFFVGLGQNIVFLGALALACYLNHSIELTLSAVIWASIPYMLLVIAWYWTLSRGFAQ
jgi:O-antigen/teichoic acid export membrane protein